MTAQHVEEITLIDAANEDFKLILNSEDARARNGNTQLLFSYNSCNVRVVLQFFLFTYVIKHSSSSEESSDSDEFNMFTAYIANAAVNVTFYLFNCLYHRSSQNSTKNVPL